MSFYNSLQSKIFANRFQLVKSNTNNYTNNQEFTHIHPINNKKKSVFYDKKQNEVAKRFTLVRNK